MRFNTEALLVFGNWFLLGATLYLMGSLGGELLYWQILNIPYPICFPILSLTGPFIILNNRKTKTTLMGMDDSRPLVLL